MKENCVQIPWDVFEDLLTDRRSFWDDGEHRTVPDCVWDYAMEMLRECDGCNDPEFNDPKYIVDNLVVNGSWEELAEARRWNDNYRELTDDELAEAIEDEGGAVAIFRDERLILWNLGF